MIVVTSRKNKALERTKAAYKNAYAEKKFDDFSKHFKNSFKSMFSSTKRAGPDNHQRTVSAVIKRIPFPQRV